jgi:hypothetical protein
MNATPPTQVVTDEELVEAIVCELGRYGLNDPRDIERRPILLSIYARDEVRRSIERVRQKEQLSLQHRIRFRVIAAQLRAAKRALDILAAALPEDLARSIREMRDRLPQREPSPFMDQVKYRCATEAFDLMEMFSKEVPTGTGRSGTRRPGPFQTISAILYQAVTYKEGKNMQRACNHVLRARRHLPRNIPERS